MWRSLFFFFFFFFQAEDGIRDLTVTGVQTCALPICWSRSPGESPLLPGMGSIGLLRPLEIDSNFNVEIPRKSQRVGPGVACVHILNRDVCFWDIAMAFLGVFGAWATNY